MSQLPVLSGKQLVKFLQKLGYQEIRQRGSHIRLACPSRKSITVPDYKVIDRSLLRKILRDAEMTTDEFKKLIQ
jgi:predicted RNA binding protein YcfA (HicA-like mRNA interferase family)